MPDADPTPEAPRRVTRWDRPPPPHDWRWWVGGLGKVLITTGLMMFAFVAYQLWGTGIEAARAQNSLENEFEELLADTSTTAPDASAGSMPGVSVPVDSVVPDSVPGVSTPGTSDPAVTGAGGDPDESAPPTVKDLPAVDEGDPIARLEIPSIGSDHIVVAGVSTADLKKGPGHYPETPLPGQLGNAAIAGHRTTYGQPFFNIDQVETGDEIVVTTLAGRFVYRATGTQIVSPSDYHVVATTDPTVATLTITSCHPKWTARQRIVLSAELDVEASSGPAGEPLINYGRPIDDESSAAADPTNTVAGGDAAGPADPAGDTDGGAAINAGIADAFGEGWFSDPDAYPHVVAWGVLLAAIAVGSYLLCRWARRYWVGILAGVIPFIVTLYFFFQNVNRLLPPNL